MAEQEELNYQQQRRRLFGEVAQEKDKLADQFQKQKAAFDLKLKENTELHDRYIMSCDVRMYVVCTHVCMYVCTYILVSLLPTICTYKQKLANQ